MSWIDYDAVVVGAGPAGCATARGIARAGYRVLLVEKRRVVGEPAYCSGLVSARGLAEAGIGDGLIINEIKGGWVNAASGRQLNLGGDRVYALVIDRTAFDQRLAVQAQEAGAVLLLDSRLDSIERADHSLRLDIERKGTRRQVRTKLLIGADGAGSSVARWVSPAACNGAVAAMAGEGWLHGAEPQRVQIFVGPSVAPGWFGWIIPLGDGRVRVGIGNGNHAPVSARRLFDNMLCAFPQHFLGLRLERLFTKPIPIYTPIKTYVDNVLLVGDAARQVKPTSGGGIHAGLVGARHCARIAAAALRKGDCSAIFLSQYEAAWKAEVGHELERGIDLRAAFVGLSERELDDILAIFGTPPMQRITSAFGDVDSPSVVVECLVRAAPMLRHFLHAPLCFPTRWASDLLSVVSRGVGKGRRAAPVDGPAANSHSRQELAGVEGLVLLDSSDSTHVEPIEVSSSLAEACRHLGSSAGP